MRKCAILFVNVILAMSLVACGGKEESTTQEVTTVEATTEATTEEITTTEEPTTEEAIVDDATSSDSDAAESDYAIKLSKDTYVSGETIYFSLENFEDFAFDYSRKPWVGILDTNEDFAKELDADEHDLWYYNLQSDDDRVFKVKIGEDVELSPGDYQIIVTDTDNGHEDGNVLAKVNFTVAEGDAAQENDPVIMLHKNTYKNGETIRFALANFENVSFDYSRKPWVGILDTDEDFTKELDADEHDLWYYNLTSDSERMFKVKIGEDVELSPGNYQIIVTDTDNGHEDGNVLAKVNFTVE